MIFLELKIKVFFVFKGIFLVNFVLKNVIGLDEVGIGDFFGLIMVCVVYVDVEMMFLLKELGVKDLKVMKDLEICCIVEKIMLFVLYSVLFCFNFKYNEF